jgi:hypothetical protein
MADLDFEAVGIATGSPSLLPAIEGLVGYWSFDSITAGTTPDLSGNGNDATVHSPSSPALVVGQFGNALNCTGSGGGTYASIPNLTLSPPFSISMWVESSSNNNPINQAMWLTGTGSPDLELGSGNSLSYSAGDVFDGVNFSATLPLSTAALLSYVVANGTIKLYVNEILTSAEPFTPNVISALTIGAFDPSHGGSQRFFNGSIDDVWVLDREIAPLDISQIATHGPALSFVTSLSATEFDLGSPDFSAATPTAALVSTPNDIDTASPEIDTPTLAVIVTGVDLNANGVTTSSPAIDVPAMGIIIALAGAGLATGSPTIGTATIETADQLAAIVLATGNPVITTATIAQAVHPVPVGIITASPAISAPVVETADALAAVALVTSSPSLPSLMVGLPGIVAAVPLATGSPVLGSVAVVQRQQLVATALSTGSPAIGTPEGGYVFGASPLVIASPALGASTVNQIAALVAVPLAAGSPSLDGPALAQVQSMISLGIATAPPVLAIPVASMPFGEIVVLAGVGLQTGGVIIGTMAASAPASTLPPALRAPSLVAARAVPPRLPGPPIGIGARLPVPIPSWVTRVPDAYTRTPPPAWTMPPPSQTRFAATFLRSGRLIGGGGLT